MGVWHLSGVGLNPGAVTVPLTYIYLALKQASKGNERAKKFFETSGEIGQELKGAPEEIVIFTSREVITGEKRRDSTDEWFGTCRAESVPKTITRYLSRLLDELEDESFSRFYDGEWIKNIYFVEVNHENFDDCYLKIATTMYALERKEVWVNMIGGSNQINLSLLISGSYSAVPSRYYYIFQSQTDLLHPEIETPDFRNPQVIDILEEKWNEIPVFHLELGKLIRELSQRFCGRDVINTGEVYQILENLGYPRQYFAKLRGRVINVKGDAVSKGPLFEKMENMISKIEKQNIKNVSKWKKWCKEKNILWRCSLEGNLEKIE